MKWNDKFIKTNKEIDGIIYYARKQTNELGLIYIVKGWSESDKENRYVNIDEDGNYVEVQIEVAEFFISNSDNENSMWDEIDSTTIAINDKGKKECSNFYKKEWLESNEALAIIEVKKEINNILYPLFISTSPQARVNIEVTDIEILLLELSSCADFIDEKGNPNYLGWNPEINYWPLQKTIDLFNMLDAKMVDDKNFYQEDLETWKWFENEMKSPMRKGKALHGRVKKITRPLEDDRHLKLVRKLRK